MKQLSEQVSLERKLEEITISEFRKQPGEVMAQIALGKTFVITKGGKYVAVISRVPGEHLAMDIQRNGAVKYKLES
jgi:antitoxin (DNA-binding transcriptional repressor) of toxin-antitoxin stability system